MALERLDKIIASQGTYSRKDVKSLVAHGKVQVDGAVVKKADIKIDSDQAEILVGGVPFTVKKQVYLVLHKPQGYVSATEDGNFPTVLELVPEEYSRRGLFPAGRLDKDTTGLMVLTDDGQFAHRILSPKRHVQKQYAVTTDLPMTAEMVEGFAQGIQLSDGVCKPALLELTGTYTGNVTLTEGRYHQIKRMFGCYGAKVVGLHRFGMGAFQLPADLEQGQWRELTAQELAQIETRTEAADREAEKNQREQEEGQQA